MIFRVLADIVVFAHLAFILFVLFGGLLCLRWRWIPLVHLPAAVWGAAVEIFRWYCPLTPLENALRRASDSTGYAGGFVEHYLVPLIYPDELTQELQLVLGVLVVGLNVAVYLLVWRRSRTGRADQNDASW